MYDSFKTSSFCKICLLISFYTGTLSSQTPGPVFSIEHGYFESPFILEITLPDNSAEIYYTTDGSWPSLTGGTKYTVPIIISKTTVIRAAAFISGKVSGSTTTATYLFLSDIINQPNSPPGYPSSWGPYTAIAGIAVADYEIDPELVSDSLFAQRLKAALRSLPVISIATDRRYIFSHSQHPDSGGIYIHTGPPLTNTTNGTGFGWERPASFEYFSHNDSVSLQTDCTLQIHGGHSRRPEKSPKHSFRLEFKGDPGPEKLEFPFFGEGFTASYNAIVLRAGFNNSWVHHSAPERVAAQYLHDAWAKDSQRAMGHRSPGNSYAHLFINGLYWGIYSPSEKLDASYAAEYMGGEETEYDVIKDYTEVADGNISAWNRLVSLANSGLSSNASYNYVQGKNPDGTRNINYPVLVDVVNLADYMLLNFYAGNTDWDHHNWTAIRNRINPGNGFRFYCWDEEKILEDININILAENNNNCPSRIFQQLMKNADFRRLFADRVQKFCFGNGALTPGKVAERWLKRSEEIEHAIIAESARWGDYRRDVHRWQTSGPFDLYTYENHWLISRDNMLDVFFPGRTAIFINQLRTAGMFPNTYAPEYLLNGKQTEGGRINDGDTLILHATEGIIYYTTDGSDPADWSTAGMPSAEARQYSGYLILEGSSHFRARCLANGEWSACSDRFFVIPGEYVNIKVTEIHYNPDDQDYTNGSEFEFIELKNTGSTTLDLGNARFVNGIDYQFGPDYQFKPGSFIVLASNVYRFYSRYGFVPDGEYLGQLNNSGEYLALISAGGDTIFSFYYGTDAGWPHQPDGGGSSLVPVDLNPVTLQFRPEEWRSSWHRGGSPGADDLFQARLLEGGRKTELATLYQSFPNPAEERVTIPFSLDSEANIELTVHNVMGLKVKSLESGNKAAGEYLCEWDGTDSSGSRLPGGIYLLRLEVLGNGRHEELVAKILLLR